MSEARTSAWFGVVSAVALLLGEPAVLVVAAQDPDRETRQLWDDAFKKKRAQAKATAPSAGRPGSPSPPSERPEAGPEDLLLGITVWRLRPLGPGEKGAAVWSTGAEVLTAERVRVGTAFDVGERVRLSIESARTGYLYLIDRERYGDGTLGEPYLIFPRSRIRGGDNKVSAGRIVEIPDLSDNPPFFTMKRTRPDQTGDVITVLITPAPLSGVTGGAGALKLSRDQVEQWERRWSAPTKRIELAEGSGTLYTKAEHEAAGTSARLLAYDEPVPQTMYRIDAKKGDPLVVTIPLGMKRDTP